MPHLWTFREPRLLLRTTEGLRTWHLLLSQLVNHHFHPQLHLIIVIIIVIAIITIIIMTILTRSPLAHPWPQLRSSGQREEPGNPRSWAGQTILIILVILVLFYNKKVNEKETRLYGADVNPPGGFSKDEVEVKVKVGEVKEVKAKVGLRGKARTLEILLWEQGSDQIMSIKVVKWLLVIILNKLLDGIGYNGW